MEILLQLIQSVGFPIVCCYFLYDYIKKRDNSFTEERKYFLQVIENNTQAIRNLSDQIERGKSE